MAFNASGSPTIPTSRLSRELRRRGWELIRITGHCIYQHGDGTQISLPKRLTKDCLMGPAAKIIMSKAAIGTTREKGWEAALRKWKVCLEEPDLAENSRRRVEKSGMVFHQTLWKLIEDRPFFAFGESLGPATAPSVDQQESFKVHFRTHFLHARLLDALRLGSPSDVIEAIAAHYVNARELLQLSHSDSMEVSKVGREPSNSLFDDVDAEGINELLHDAADTGVELTILTPPQNLIFRRHSSVDCMRRGAGPEKAITAWCRSRSC